MEIVHTSKSAAGLNQLTSQLSSRPPVSVPLPLQLYLLSPENVSCLVYFSVEFHSEEDFNISCDFKLQLYFYKFQWQSLIFMLDFKHRDFEDERERETPTSGFSGSLSGSSNLVGVSYS